MTVALGPLQKALVEAGLAEMPKPQRRNMKKFNCHRCKHPMTRVPDSNIMYCEQCGQYFLFDKAM